MDWVWYILMDAFGKWNAIIMLIAVSKFLNVGSYSGGQTQLDVSRLETLSPGYNPTSVCSGRCDKCVQNGQVPIVFLEGDVYILGVFSIHDYEANLFECGAWRKTGNDALIAEGFLHAIELMSEETGIKFGAIGIDACYSPLRITSLLTDFMANINPYNSDLFPRHVPREKIVGVIGCRSSGCTLATASIFMPMKTPVISYGASSPDLDDRVNYQFFLRNVPSDVYQAQVMVNIIRKMGWEYVGLLYVENNYGTKGMQAFRNIADEEGSGICVPQEFGITEKNNESVDNDLFFNAYMHFRTLQVKVVVFFGIDERFEKFIETMEQKDRDGRFIFLASEEWGTNKDILDAGKKSARGSITLQLEKLNWDSQASFVEHLKKVELTKTTNIWFGEFWQNLFQCNFKGGFVNEFTRECDPSLKLSQEQIEYYVNGQRLNHVVNAVYAMGKAFKTIKSTKCGNMFPCSYLKENPEGTVEEIMKQKFNTSQQDRDMFDQHGNGAIGFDVFNIQTKDNGITYEYVKVGTYGPQLNDLNVDLFKFYDKSGQPVSMNVNCSGTLCNKCKHRTTPIVPVTPKPIAEEESSSDYKDSEILIISLIIVLFIAIAVTIAVLFLCLNRKCKDIEKKLAAPPKEEQTYDRIVYPGLYNFSANELPLADQNHSHYQDSPYRMNSSHSGTGVNNPAFTPDSEHVDSISQDFAMRRHNPTSTVNSPQFSDDHRKVPDNKHHFGSPVMQNYNGQPMPSSAVGRSNIGSHAYTNTDGDSVPTWSGNESTVSQNNPVPARSPSDIVQYSTLSHGSVISQPTGMQDPNLSGVIMAAPYSGGLEASSYGNPGGIPVLYKNSQTGQSYQVVQTLNSDATSTVVAEHGPHGDVLMQRRPILKNQAPQTVAYSQYLPPQQMIILPLSSIATPGQTTLPQDHFEMKDMGASPPLPHPHRTNYGKAQIISETPLTNTASPIHYASPVHAPVTGNADESAPVFQLRNSALYQNQVADVPMTNPNPTASGVNHFRQYSDPHRQHDYSTQGNEQMSPGENHSRNTATHSSATDVDADDGVHVYPEQMTMVPDVISVGSPQDVSPTVIKHFAQDEHNAKASKDPIDHATDVKFVQAPDSQMPQTEIHSDVTQV